MSLLEKVTRFTDFFSGLTTICSSLKHFAPKEFYSFSENNFHCYFYACGWNLPWNFPNLWAPLPICCLPLKIPSTWGSPSSGPGAVLDLCFTYSKVNLISAFSWNLFQIPSPISKFGWVCLKSNFRVLTKIGGIFAHSDSPVAKSTNLPCLPLHI